MADGVVFTKDQLASSKLLKPQWYAYFVKEYSKEQAGTDGSDNHIFKISVEGGEYNGVPLRVFANEKWYPPEFMEFVEVHAGTVQAGVPVKFETFVGKKGEVFVQRVTNKNTGRNENACISFRKKKEGQ